MNKKWIYVPWESKRMFSGLRSRYMISKECKWSKAKTISAE